LGGHGVSIHLNSTQVTPTPLPPSRSLLKDPDLPSLADTDANIRRILAPLKKNPKPEHSENFETTVIHTFTSLDSVDRALSVSLRITVRIHKTGNGTRRYEGSPRMRGSIFYTHRQHQGDGSG